MSASLRDNQTLSIVLNTELLELCEVGNYFKTPKRLSAYKNLYWWLHVYPNGDSKTHRGIVGISIFTSIGGFEAKYSLTIDETDIMVKDKTLFTFQRTRSNYQKLATHNKLRLTFMRGGEFTIKCKINFRIASRTIQEKSYIIDDMCIMKLNLNELRMFEPGYSIVADKQPICDITWHNVWYPCGHNEDDAGYVSVALNVEGRPVTLEISYALSINSVLVYNTFHHTFDKPINKVNFKKLYSHALCHHADEVIELMCTLVFDQSADYNLPKTPPPSYCDQKVLLKKPPSINALTKISTDLYTFKDTVTLDVNATWLTVFEPGDPFSSPPRSLPQCENLSWWITCYPNEETKKKHVSIFVYISAGGLELTQTVTVLRSDIEYHDSRSLSDSFTDEFPKVISHDKLRFGDIIKNGVFTIKCDVILKIPKETIDTLNKLVPIKDSYTVKFNRKEIHEIHEPGEKIAKRRKTIANIEWWVHFYPCSDRYDHKKRISVFFHVAEGKVLMIYSSTLLFGGVPIQERGITDSENGEALGFSFSHKLCKLADHKNDIVELVCDVIFFRSVDVSCKGSIITSFQKCMLNDSCIGKFDSNRREFVNGSDKHRWRLQCFPAGRCPKTKGNVIVVVDATTIETKTVSVKGVIKIVGTTIEKSFDMITENSERPIFLRMDVLIAHEELRQISGIIDDRLIILCEATFYTLSDLSSTIN